jgi:hypothetical protein
MPQAATARWRQWGKTARGALGRDGTRGEVCNHRPGAYMAYEATRVVVALGDPVTWCLAGTSRRDGRGVCSPFEMAEDLTDHRALGDDGNEPQCSALAKRTGDHLQGKHASQELSPRPIRGARVRILSVYPLLTWGGMTLPRRWLCGARQPP